MRIRSLGRHAMALVTVTGAVAAVFACSSTSQTDDELASDITGGTPSQNDAIVLVSDRDDHFACSGALVADNVVALSGLCADNADSVYVRFSAVLDPRLPIAAQAGPGVQRLFVPSQSEPTKLNGVCAPANPSSPRVKLLRLSTRAVGVTSLARIGATPNVGATCSVVGHGADADGGRVGQQRTATMLVTSTAACGQIKVKGVTGSIALGQWDGMLLCGGKLAGTKEWVITATPSQIDSTVLFTSLGDPAIGPAFDQAVAQLGSDAGTPDAAVPDAGPPPVPGSPCSTVDQIASTGCGNCGKKFAVCLGSADGGALKWSDYGVCEGEGVCAAGTVETSAAGCAGSTRRERACRASCNWGSYSSCR